MAKRVDPKILKNQLQVLFEQHKETLRQIDRLKYKACALEEAMTPLKEAHDQVVKLNGEDLKRETTVRVKVDTEPRKPNPFAKVYPKTCVRCSAEFIGEHKATRICPPCREKGFSAA